MSIKITRFCPSPTGLMHLGNLRTAILNFFIATQSDGKFILRIEDTNEDRSMKEYADYICKDLDWMELRWEEGPKVGGPHEPYFQSERGKIYDKYYEILLKKDLIYPCFTSEEELKIIRRNQLSSGQPPRYPGTWSRASKDEVKEEEKVRTCVACPGLPLHVRNCVRACVCYKTKTPFSVFNF